VFLFFLLVEGRLAAHHAILETAQRLCAERSEPVFTPDEIVRALPHLNAQTVRTHVTSRCCVDARPHHQSRLAYFRKIGRGRYELLEEHRLPKGRSAAKPRVSQRTQRPQRETIHAVITKDGSTYVVDCLEIAVVTQGRTLDEALKNLMEAVSLHLDGEDLTTLGLGSLKRIQVSYELPTDVTAA
jgi:predicted RNase H-like HicB family nuclease